MLFKRALLAALAAALLVIPAVSYAQNDPPPSANSDQKGRPADRDRDRGARDRTPAPAATRDQGRDRATRRIPQEHAARTAPGGQKGPTSGSQATQERAARTPSGQVGPQGAPTGSATRERAARTTPRGQAVQRPSGVATRERAPAPPPNVQYQNRYQDLRNNPSFRVATPRWTRGDRLPDRYRQSRYFVNDWRERRLRPPPRGYRWVRDDVNNYYLMLIATG